MLREATFVASMDYSTRRLARFSHPDVWTVRAGDGMPESPSTAATRSAGGGFVRDKFVISLTLVWPAAGVLNRRLGGRNLSGRQVVNEDASRGVYIANPSHLAGRLLAVL